MTHKTFLLLILDGFGISPANEFNAITTACMPTWDYLWNRYPHALLDASGLAVGLPKGQIGNSEVGHMTIGAGRVLYQDLTRINQAIAEGCLLDNPVIQHVMTLGKNHPIHLMGLLSAGGVHSHQDHLFELIKIFSEAGCNTIYLHAFLDGRDVAPKEAEQSLQKLMEVCARYPQAKLASICGRYYAMDRDQRWDRTQKAYDALTSQQTSYQANDGLTALKMAYARGESDEFIQPTWIANAPMIQDHDIVFFTNFRSDRARQLSQAFLQADFTHFHRAAVPKLAAFVSMTEYAKDIASQVVFLPQNLINSLGEYLALCHKTQLRITETEKYAHVTFFFNGGKEQPFTGEERILVPSLNIATYDLQPEMSAKVITEKLIGAIQEARFDLIICNFANPDMLGHTGNFQATVQGLEIIDECLKKLYQTIKANDGEILITADHGNADCLFDQKKHQPHTAHTTSLVPFVYIGQPAEVLQAQGTLASVAPTLLSLMNLAIPKEMTGSVIFKVL